MALIQDTASSYLEGIKPYSDFSKYLAWKDFFDSNLARAGASQRTEGYYQPILSRNIDALRTDMAGRGLFRSGVRRRAEYDTAEEIADLEAQMIEKLYAQRQDEARQAYVAEQDRF